MHQPARGVEALTIVCVFNDPAVREKCLDRSLAAYSGPVRIDYIPVDNTAHAFTSAGAAINHGARRAEHEVVVSVHQDVYLHSIDRLAEAAVALHDSGWGVLGANGVTHAGVWMGRLRDRILLIGVPAQTPHEVDSLDEVLFMARRDDLLEHPLTEDPDLAWHAYAVEYGLRMRTLGRRVGAVDTALTHNSLTINLARLTDAHARVGDLYPQFRPVATTCGTVGESPRRWRTHPWVRANGWRLRWLRQSLDAARLRRVTSAPIVLADINHEVDLLDFSEAAPLIVLNLDRPGGFAGAVGSAPVSLARHGRAVVMQAFDDLEELVVALDALPRDAHLLVTGLLPDDLNRLSTSLDRRPWLVGLQWAEAWVLGGPNALEPPAQWRLPRATPLGRRRSGSAA